MMMLKKAFLTFTGITIKKKWRWRGGRASPLPLLVFRTAHQTQEEEADAGQGL